MNQVLRQPDVEDAWMRLLTRYILCEILKVFLCAMIALTAVMMMAVVVQTAVREGLGLQPILKLVPFALPYSLRFTVPGTILFAVCSVFGRMSADNEIVAVKAAGVSPWAIVGPALVLALFISPLAVWLNDLAVSWGRTGIHRVVLQSVEQIAYGMLKKKGSYNSDEFSINVQRVEDRRLIKPIISIHTSDGLISFSAAEAEMRLDPDEDALSITLIDCEIEGGGEQWHGLVDRHTQLVPLSTASRQGEISNRPADLPWSRISPEAARRRKELAAIKTRLAAHASYQMMTGDLDSLGQEQWRRPLAKIGSTRIQLHKLETEPWRRMAVGFSCFFFVLVGAPLAVLLRNSEFLVTFFLAFLPVLLVYYPLLAFGVDRAKVGDVPPYSVWLGNVVFGLVGLWLVRKVMRR